MNQENTENEAIDLSQGSRAPPSSPIHMPQTQDQNVVFHSALRYMLACLDYANLLNLYCTNDYLCDLVRYYVPNFVINPNNVDLRCQVGSPKLNLNVLTVLNEKFPTINKIMVDTGDFIENGPSRIIYELSKFKYLEHLAICIRPATSLYCGGVFPNLKTLQISAYETNAKNNEDILYPFLMNSFHLEELIYNYGFICKDSIDMLSRRDIKSLTLANIDIYSENVLYSILKSNLKLTNLQLYFTSKVSSIRFIKLIRKVFKILPTIKNLEYFTSNLCLIDFTPSMFNDCENLKYVKLYYNIEANTCQIINFIEKVPSLKNIKIEMHEIKTHTYSAQKSRMTSHVDVFRRKIIEAANQIIHSDFTIFTLTEN